MLAVNLSLLSVLGVVNPNSPVGPIQIIVYCSVVSTTPSIVFSLALLNVYNNRRLLIVVRLPRLTVVSRDVHVGS